MTEQHEHLISLFLQTPSELSEEQTRELSNWIVEDSANTKEFIQASLFRRSIHDILINSDKARNNILHEGMNSDSFFDKRVWGELLKEEAIADKVEIKIPSPAEEAPTPKIEPERTARKINKVTFITSILSTAAMFFLIVYLEFLPSTANVAVATLTDSVDAQWAESTFALGSENFRLTTNHAPLMLREGYAELIFDNDAKVVIEAPAEFQVISYDQIRLTYGRLFTTVPPGATGFIVSTPNSKIIDLGTEFGVEAGINGTTELHVVKGKASFVSGPKDYKTNVLVRENFARKVTTDSLESVDIVYDKKMFVRQIASQSHFVWRGQNLNLADIVGGGDGFGTGRLSQGIEAATGEVIQTMTTTDVLSSSTGYVPVPTNAYIDGVFVPGIGSGSARITSIGLPTEAFPKTSGMRWGYILNGAWHKSFDVPRHNLQLDGVTVDGLRNPAIMMHSNLGITFDLSAIRKKLPGMKIQSFTSAFGISETVEKWLKSRDFGDLGDTPEVAKLSTERQSTAEFWVFLDGKKVLRQMASSASEAGQIDIPIDETVRFLTLAVTEADDSCMFDWALFAQPELVLESSE